MTRALLIVLATLSGCGPSEPLGTPLERGQWQMKTEFATPKIDGLSLDELRKQLPADSDRTECKTPVVQTGPRVMDNFNFNRTACSIDKATAENGVIAAEGQCPELARILAKDAGSADFKIDNSASWIKIAGTYEPRYLKIDADIVMTVTTDRGETSRISMNATHTAERIGDCP